MKVRRKRTRRGKHRSRRLSYGEACTYVEREIAKYRFDPYRRDLILNELYDYIGDHNRDGIPRKELDRRLMEVFMVPGRAPLLYREAIERLLNQNC